MQQTDGDFLIWHEILKMWIDHVLSQKIVSAKIIACNDEVVVGEVFENLIKKKEMITKWLYSPVKNDYFNIRNNIQFQMNIMITFIRINPVSYQSQPFLLSQFVSC